MARGTFVVNIHGGESATWQGTIKWAEEGMTQNFRSALELIKMIDGALDHVDSIEKEYLAER